MNQRRPKQLSSPESNHAQLIINHLSINQEEKKRKMSCLLHKQRTTTCLTCAFQIFFFFFFPFLHYINIKPFLQFKASSQIHEELDRPNVPACLPDKTLIGHQFLSQIQPTNLRRVVLPMCVYLSTYHSTYPAQEDLDQASREAAGAGRWSSSSRATW